MSAKLKILTPWKQPESRPVYLQEMVDFYAERGWTLVEEWIDPWEDEDGEHEGWWCYELVHEELIDGKLHMWHVTPISLVAWPEQWAVTVELARLGWERYRESVLESKEAP